MRIEQPSFPLTADTFAAALRTGHGRAMQQIERHGPHGLEDDIIEACLTCLVYDPQCEAERAPWLFSMLDRSKLNAKVVQAIAAMIKEPPPEDHRDMDQRSAILKELAAAGSDEARRLLYASLARLSHTANVIGADQIMALDGLDGLMHVARQLGRWLRADPDFWVYDHLGAQFDASTGIPGGFAALEREAELDADVANYLSALRKTHESQSGSSSRFNPTGYTGADIVAYVKQNPKDPCHWFRAWGVQTASDQRETVFAALLAADEPEHAKRLFRCFPKTGVPRFDPRLLRWIAHSDEQICWAAVKALAPIQHAELRQAALQLIADGHMANGIALLVNNFEAGDFARCEAHLEPLEDADQTHDLVERLLDLCGAHPGAQALHCLLYVYEYSPCSTCRRQAVKALINTKTAPAWVVTEAMFDADPDTRALVEAGRSSVQSGVATQRLRD